MPPNSPDKYLEPSDAGFLDEELIITLSDDDNEAMNQLGEDGYDDDADADEDEELAAYLKSSRMFFSVRIRAVQYGVIKTTVKGKLMTLPAVVLALTFTLKADEPQKCRYKWAKLSLGFSSTKPKNERTDVEVPLLHAYSPVRVEGPVKSVGVTNSHEYGVTIPFWESGSLSARVNYEFEYEKEGRMVIDGVEELRRPPRVAWTFHESPNYEHTYSGMIPSIVGGAMVVACDGEFRSTVSLRTKVGWRRLVDKNADVQWPLKGSTRDPIILNPGSVLNGIPVEERKELGYLDLASFVSVSG